MPSRCLLALLDASSPCEHVAAAAAQLGVAMEADVVLAVSPGDVPFANLSRQLSHWLGEARSAGAHAATMLLDIDDPAAVVRAASDHRAALVVLASISDETPSASAVLDALRTLKTPALVIAPSGLIGAVA